MYNAANNASSQLAQAISAADTSLTVLDGSSFPDAPFVVSIEDEIIEVRSKSGNTFSALVRGLEGTVPAAHASGSRVENRFTAGTYQQIVDEINALAGVRIVEMGSNANGEYVRWENGLQVCYRPFTEISTVSENWVQVSRQNLTIYNYTPGGNYPKWVFPAAFTTTPASFIAGDFSGAGILEAILVFGTTATQTQWAVEGLNPTSKICVSLLVIGRWK